jgi:proline iminopeptidase
VFVVGGTQDDPVILLHGGSRVPDYLTGVAGSLTLKHRVIRYDQRGTSRSTVHDGRFRLAEHVKDLEAIRGAYGHKRLSLCVHSWGATLAQLYAGRYPDRAAKLFLCNSGIGLGEDWKAMERAVMADNRGPGKVDSRTWGSTNSYRCCREGWETVEPAG